MAFLDVRTVPGRVVPSASIFAGRTEDRVLQETAEQARVCPGFPGLSPLLVASCCGGFLIGFFVEQDYRVIVIMHPLVRDLYKRAIIAGRDYPHPDGLDYVRRTWKAALRDSKNCPSCYRSSGTSDSPKPNCLADPKCEKEVRLAVGRGRKMVNEMVGVIQLKKYRTMRRRYGDGNDLEAEERRLRDAIAGAGYDLGTTGATTSKE